MLYITLNNNEDARKLFVKRENAKYCMGVFRISQEDTFTKKGVTMTMRQLSHLFSW